MTHSSLLNFAESFHRTVQPNTIEYEGRTLRFKLNEDADPNDFLNTASILFEVDHILGRKYEINLKRIKIENYFVFHNVEEFFNKYELYESRFAESALLILQSNESFLLKDIAEPYSQAKALIFNYYQYRRLIIFLRDNPIFTTLYNSTNDEFIILSKSNGTLYIGFSYHERRVEDLDNLEPVLENIGSLFEKKEFIQFFKEIIFDAGLHTKDNKDRLFEIIKHINVIINLAEKDYENYVLDFSFDTIKAKFKEERNKYFESLDKNVEAVNKQVMSLPLTFAATAFATYQVKDKPLILLLIIVAYGLYTLVAFKVLGISEYNITCLNEDVLKEEDSIKNNFKKNLEDFAPDFQKIKNKIANVTSLTYCLKWILGSLLIIFLGYAFYQILGKGTSSNIIQLPSDKVKMIYIENTDSIKDSIVQMSKGRPILIAPDSIVSVGKKILDQQASDTIVNKGSNEVLNRRN